MKGGGGDNKKDLKKREKRRPLEESLVLEYPFFLQERLIRIYFVLHSCFIHTEAFVCEMFVFTHHLHVSEAEWAGCGGRLQVL